MGDLKKLMKVCEIILKYEGMEEEYVSAEHDVLYLPLPEDLSKEDEEFLGSDEINCSVGEEDSIIFYT